jgi:hypothetical protein
MQGIDQSDLEKENAMLHAAIAEFVKASKWADEAWKAQPHIKRLFHIANTGNEQPMKPRKGG